jgi:hypothetical protein
MKVHRKARVAIHEPIAGRRMIPHMKTERTKIETGPRDALIIVKIVHTIVWVFFVACILAVPVTAGVQRFKLSAVFAGLVLVECLVLAVNRCRCPLTDLAVRYAPEDSPNFDIYLPRLVAKYNKQIFGTIFVLGGLFALAEWLLAER